MARTVVGKVGWKVIKEIRRKIGGKYGEKWTNKEIIICHAWR